MLKIPVFAKVHVEIDPDKNFSPVTAAISIVRDFLMQKGCIQVERVRCTLPQVEGETWTVDLAAEVESYEFRIMTLETEVAMLRDAIKSAQLKVNATMDDENEMVFRLVDKDAQI